MSYFSECVDVKHTRITEDRVENAYASIFMLEIGVLLAELRAKKLGVRPGPWLVAVRSVA